MLAGGRGSRLGGREKGEIRINGRRLIDIVVSGALSAGCEKAMIAGDLISADATTVREDPPFSGPVAGLAAALPGASSDWILLLACDLPRAAKLCHLLAGSFREITPDTDGLVALTGSRIQWLAGIYRRSSIEAELEKLESVEGTSLRTLFGDMNLREVEDPDGLARDIDTPEELEIFTRGREAP